VTGFREIILVKRHDGFGNRAAGDTYHAIVPRAYSEAAGKRRAFGQLKRDHPSENPMAWDVKP
jgi:hypothetical protein